MAPKTKSLLILFSLALFFSSAWAYLSYNILTVSQRTPLTTTIQVADSQGVEEEELVPGEADQQAQAPLTPPITPAPEAPAPDDRKPGSTLDQATLDALGLEEPIEEEGVFYATATPDDTIYPQWYTTVIDAPLAWDTTSGSPSTLVAVIDTGFALDHEDLSAAWFTNSGEQGTTQLGDACWLGVAEDKQTNNCDDDGNGYIDDWRGWDFSNNDSSPQAGDNYAPGASHGTKSAGLVGARGNNGVGVASVNWNTQLLPLQALYDQGYGYSTDITAAIYYAVEMGADVINMSLGGSTPDSYTLAAVRYAQQNNVIVVASAGNCGLNQTDPDCVGYPSPGGMGYPARYPDTIAVGATTSTDARASFSSYGVELDIVAPGSGSIRTPSWSTSNQTSLYATSSYGTSFSAPIVPGAIALVKGEFPELSADEVLALFANSSDKVAGMSGEDWTEEYGYGRLNVAALLSEMAKYKQQLNKGSGDVDDRSSSTKPLLSSSTGHTSSTKITASSTVRTYCITTPNTLCTLRLLRVGASGVKDYTAIRTNNQGLAVFEWTKSDITSGTWDAKVTANGLTSDKERLFIQ